MVDLAGGVLWESEPRGYLGPMVNTDGSMVVREWPEPGVLAFSKLRPTVTGKSELLFKGRFTQKGFHFFMPRGDRVFFIRPMFESDIYVMDLEW